MMIIMYTKLYLDVGRGKKYPRQPKDENSLAKQVGISFITMIRIYLNFS